jgi:signal transduction histidine kinase
VAPALEIAVPRRDGIVHLSLSVSSLDAGGDRQGIVCLLSDVTPVRELEEQLRLKEALARLGELTAGIAHEFRNGLATIHGYSRLLRPEALPDAYRPYVDGIRQESESLGHVMTNFLKFARPDPAAFATVDLQAIAQRAVDDLSHELPAQTVVQVEGTFAPVEGDEVLLRQVFGNLIRNAAEACSTADVTPTVRVRGSVDGRACRVSVEDNGPGVPDDARTRIFEPFFTTRSRGTGLGLAIVQKVVVNHNGRVSASRSALGGASINLVFPLAGPRTSVTH